jgi:hypothetical protein
MEINKHMSLVSYGSIIEDFKSLAQIKNQIKQMKSGMVKQHRLDCYYFEKNPNCVINKMKEIGKLPLQSYIEVFIPSDNYPPHKDEGGTSYFIPIESGEFFIDGVNYPVIPFVLYGFDDGKLHNTNFPAIMLK